MSSLDVPTNSVAQVAAAIEEKRRPNGALENQKQSATSNTLSAESTSAAVADAAARGSPRRKPSRKASRNLQGRAFSAPRAASLERQHAQQEDLKALGQVLDASPRKYGGRSRATVPVRRGTTKTQASGMDGGAAREFSYKTPPNNRQGQVIVDADAENLKHQIGGCETVEGGRPQRAPAERAVLEKRDPPRSASAMGYYIPSDEPGRERENRRPSHEQTSRIPVRHSAESSRPRTNDRNDGPSGTVGGVHLMGVPDAPSKIRGTPVGNPMAGRPQWVPERDRWRPHWL